MQSKSATRRNFNPFTTTNDHKENLIAIIIHDQAEGKWKLTKLSTGQIQPRYHTKFSETVDGEIYGHQLREFVYRSLILEVKGLKRCFTN